MGIFSDWSGKADAQRKQGNRKQFDDAMVAQNARIEEANKISNDPQLGQMILAAQQKIESDDTSGLEKWIKNMPTKILKADASHAEARYRPGSKLVTYTGVDVDGKPIQETYKGGITEIKADSVILKNSAPLKYPKGHPQADETVEGRYDEENNFIPEKGGGTLLYNEYVSDTKFVKDNYGVDAGLEEKEGVKLQPSYMIEIPGDSEKDVLVFTTKGSELHMHGGDYVVLDVKNNKVTSRHAIAKSFLSGENATYIPFEKAVERNQG